jgi:DNA-binding transcriptional LysR family regulator
MMDRLSRIEAFVRVAEVGSFSKAARSLHMSQPSVSKAVAELERQLGTQLLNRTTRHVSLTEGGKVYYDRMKQVTTLLAEADNTAARAQADIQGLLRINTSVVLSSALVLPASLLFRSLHPGMEIEIVADDRRVELVSQATDVAIRIGLLDDSTMRVRRAGSASIRFFASPAYLITRGLDPDSERGFSGLDVIQYAGRPALPDWPAPSDPGDVRTALRVSNMVLAREAALAGAGVAALADFLVRGDVAAGTLVPVLSQTTLPSLEISLLHPFSQTPPRRITMFLDFLLDQWRRNGALAA